MNCLKVFGVVQEFEVTAWKITGEGGLLRVFTVLYLGAAYPAHMTTTSLTSVGSDASSPELTRRTSPGSGHAAEMLDVEDLDLGYIAETCPSQLPNRTRRATSRAGLSGG